MSSDTREAYGATTSTFVAGGRGTVRRLRDAGAIRRHLKEHEAVRHRAGLFDLSHMAQFWLTGEMVARWADTLTINAVGTMKPMQARYNIFCNEGGGAHDDTIFYRLEHGWLLVVNAPTPRRCGSCSTTGFRIRGSRSRTATDGARSLRFKGRRSVEMLQPHVDVDLG